MGFVILVEDAGTDPWVRSAEAVMGIEVVMDVDGEVVAALLLVAVASAMGGVPRILPPP